MNPVMPNFMTTNSPSLLFKFALTLALFLLPALASASDIKVWVLVLQNPAAPQTIVSNNPEERDGLLAAGWRLSGTGLTHSEAGLHRGLLHRMLRTDPEVVRRLAITPQELAANVADGFVSEGAMGHVQLQEAQGLIPVHAFSKEGRRIWVVDHHDQYWADKNGWKRDGGIFWLRPVAGK
jgi:hypothetical protein